MLNFLFSKAHHTWVATPSLLKKISDVIANDQYLQKYAQPSQQDEEARERDVARVQAQGTELSETGRFQDILCFLDQLLCSDVTNTGNQNKHQHRTFNDGDATNSDDRKIFFAMENWYIIPENMNHLYIRQHGKITTIPKDITLGTQHNEIVNLLASAKDSLPQNNDIDCGEERIQHFQSTIKETIDEDRSLSIPNRKRLQRMLDGLEPISITTGHGELSGTEHSNDENDVTGRQFHIKNLKIDYPGSFIHRSIWPWQYKDFRPTVVTHPTNEWFHRRARIMTPGNSENEDALSNTMTTQNHWWHHIKTFHNHLFCSPSECVSQLQNQAYWYLIGMLLVGCGLIMIASILTNIPIIVLIGEPVSILVSSAYLSYTIMNFMLMLTHNKSALEILSPEMQRSEHEERYTTPASEFKEIVEIQLNNPQSPIGNIDQNPENKGKTPDEDANSTSWLNQLIG